MFCFKIIMLCNLLSVNNVKIRSIQSFWMVLNPTAVSVPHLCWALQSFRSRLWRLKKQLLYVKRSDLSIIDLRSYFIRSPRSDWSVFTFNCTHHQNETWLPPDSSPPSSSCPQCSALWVKSALFDSETIGAHHGTNFICFKLCQTMWPNHVTRVSVLSFQRFWNANLYAFFLLFVFVQFVHCKKNLQMTWTLEQFWPIQITVMCRNINCPYVCKTRRDSKVTGLAPSWLEVKGCNGSS